MSSYTCDLRAVGRTTDAAGAGGCALSALCQRGHMTAQTGLVIAVREASYFHFSNAKQENVNITPQQAPSISRSLLFVFFCPFSPSLTH